MISASTTAATAKALADTSEAVPRKACVVPGASPIWQRAHDDSIIGRILSPKLMTSVGWLSGGVSS